uniref:Chlorophyll a-b binding proteinic n=1 Tax=Rhizophora mucronata TaxID=61149 RepID=A0A2P2NUE4_RHIMU
MNEEDVAAAAVVAAMTRI